MRYRHRQLGIWTLAIGLASMLFLVLLLLFVEPHPIGIVVLCILAVCFLNFATLTVEVNDRGVLLKFGPGIIRKKFPLGSIKAARAARNEWYYGLGIRMLPNGYLFNVSGLDAVEIDTVDGRTHRIGTDEPAELLKAIQDACRLAG